MLRPRGLLKFTNFCKLPSIFKSLRFSAISAASWIMPIAVNSSACCSKSGSLEMNLHHHVRITQTSSINEHTGKPSCPLDRAKCDAWWCLADLHYDFQENFPRFVSFWESYLASTGGGAPCSLISFSKAAGPAPCRLSLASGRTLSHSFKDARVFACKARNC